MEYQICKKCIMDTSDPDITFDDRGWCNHCVRYLEELPKRMVHENQAKNTLDKLVDKIKSDGKNKEYDCIVGVSGGVDSTWVAYLCKKMGLRPLAVHFDNGWNSELAVSNIEKTLDQLDIDLYTYVIDWNRFKDLQLSFLKASTPDGEVPTDHMINALLFREAQNRNIGYIMHGMNFATESMSVPAWAYGHSDWKYIKSVHKIFGSSKLSGFPHYNFVDLFWWMMIKRIKMVSLLNYVNYNKEEAMSTIKYELGWEYYGGKHYESVYTRFYQGYVLPNKFNIDKRRLHLSDLIQSGQLTREQALEEIKEPSYPPKLLKQDRDFVMKKFGLTEEEFQNLMDLPVKSFKNYPNNFLVVQRLKKLLNYLRFKGYYSK